MTKEQVYDLLWENPIEIGHWIGFRDLTEINNKWLKEFLYLKTDHTLQGHRGSYKTTTLSLFFAIHAITKPNETLLYFRKTGSDVVEITRQTINILNSGCMKKICKIIHGEELQLVKATNTEINTNLSTRVVGTSQIVGLGIGTSITGKHADIVVTDDIVNINDRISRAERERTKIAYQELINVKNRGGRFINTGTPWHKDDAFTLMPNPEKYDCYSTGLISEEELNDIKSKMLPSLFSANYELKHIASEDVIFQNPRTEADPSTLDQAKWVHVDAAYGGEDGTAFTIASRRGNDIYVFGKLWHKHVEDVMDEIIKYRKGFNAGKIRCEQNSDKGYLAKELRKRGERTLSYTENMNKFLKITTYLRGDWDNIVFVKGTDKEYIQQILDFNEEAEHDDAPDSLASLIRDMWGKKPDDQKRTPTLY